MPSITIIDDDFSTEILAENLRYYGHAVVRLASAAEALASMDQVLQSNLIILDIIMERPSDVPGKDISGGRTTGMSIYRCIREKMSDLPILVYSATTDRDVIDFIEEDSHTRFQPKWSVPSLKEFIGTIHGLLGLKNPKELPRPFIVHGHDDKTKLAVKNYLQNTLKFPEPIVLHEQAGFGRTIIEKFELYAGNSTLVFVILTPDDIAIDRDVKTDIEKHRARQNVIFELGYFLGSLGRLS